MATTPNGGYGWVICAIACWISASFGTSDFTFSVIIGPLAEEFNASLIVLSFGGEMIATLQYVLAPLFTMVGTFLGYRTTLILSCTLACISIGCSAFVDSVWDFIGLYCILPGLCFGLMNVCTVLILVTYFDEKLAIVNGMFKGAQRMGAVLHCLPINYLAMNYNHMHYSMYIATLFCICLTLMPLFYPHSAKPEESSIQEDGLKGAKDYEALPQENTSMWPGVLYFISIFLFWTGFNMTYLLLVEIIEYQSIKTLTTLERSMIVAIHCLANG